MHLTEFEQWMITGLIAGLFLIVGFFINKFFFSPKETSKSNPVQDLINQLMEKVDGLRDDVAEFKADSKVQVLRNEQAHDKFDKIDKRLYNHSERLSYLEKNHARNHGLNS
jgi:hypothetical protein